MKKTMLLHSCCGPCSSAVIERLLPDYEVSVLYYNPNITDAEEYRHRFSEQRRLLSEAYPDVGLIDAKYDRESYLEAVRGLEDEPEGGARCAVCFRLRLEETVRVARELGFECFDTTLSVSPHKNYDTLSRIARELSSEYDVPYAAGNYKKKDGFRRSMELSEEYGLYRQDFCGCEFSRRHPVQDPSERENGI